MITLLENLIDRADGSYFQPEDLELLGQKMSSWLERRQTYDFMRDRETLIVDKTLEKFQQEQEALISGLSEAIATKCRSDLAAVLRNCSMAMLLDDKELLEDRFLCWMQNIMRALRNQKINTYIYRILQEVVQDELPPPNAALMMPYLKIAHEWLSQ